MKEAFLQAMSLAASSVCVVTTDGAAGRAGVTVSAMSSVSVDTPKPTLLVCIHRLSPACEAIARNRVYCANLLNSDQADISNRFAGRDDLKGRDKFQNIGMHAGHEGLPVIENALASFECEVVHDVLVGSHRIFIGEAHEVSSKDEGTPLVYFQRGYAVPTQLLA